ncbi:gamma-glutamyl-gamma-aminobutyrate hydrolase family protein [Defluviitalea phaphyphila]|uniref:gamma-glutamyl-gamma-aminobutyrate hydrolase family protein n=1 Tax=Defluviitalea phaphyphila TaxID=1473580 RepID=UPI0007311450|nr:gamma-glutamyl-gamma-aminobutyrate hydrolase family protein [Defluviitalea phaphyphila]
MKPIIGILSTSEDTLSDYIKAVERAGGTPIVLPVVENINTLDPVINKLNGIIFTGGSDINPHCYKEYPKYGLWKVVPKRDNFEIPLAQSIS